MQFLSGVAFGPAPSHRSARHAHHPAQAHPHALAAHPSPRSSTVTAQRPDASTPQAAASATSATSATTAATAATAGQDAGSPAVPWPVSKRSLSPEPSGELQARASGTAHDGDAAAPEDGSRVPKLASLGDAGGDSIVPDGAATADTDSPWGRSRTNTKDKAALGFLLSLTTTAELAARQLADGALVPGSTTTTAASFGGAAAAGPFGANGSHGVAAAAQCVPSAGLGAATAPVEGSGAAAVAVSFGGTTERTIVDGDDPNTSSFFASGATADELTPGQSGRPTPRGSTAAASTRALVLRGDVMSRGRTGHVPSSVLEHLTESAITMVTPNGAPFSLFSVVPYRDTRSRIKKQRSKTRYSVNPYLERMGLGVAIEAVKRKKQTAESYAHLLEPAYTLVPKGIENSSYNPFFLDDPELKMGRHKTVITLPCFLGTIIQPSKPSEIKRELNEHFKETHPGIDATVTLSQIRSLKAKLLEIGLMQDLELSSIASAYVYFEKLVIRGVVNKANRRLMGAVCLLLAVKVNDPKDANYAKLLESVDRVLDISPKEVYSQEFSVYAALEFTLFLPLWEIRPHLDRIIQATKSRKTTI
ncbi:hypothetical protein HK105_207111 [Polyrhizophydium stewartii]|uniref:Cyclin N-terminal domain-containing protein n=1 Tax=Polyrhizophydium stewartii TaxID=2732419 RepID=A0ABR4N1P2_9FUNG